MRRLLKTTWLVCATLLTAGWCQGQDLEFVHGSFCGGIGVDVFGRNPLAQDMNGNVLFAAFTQSPNMPVTINAEQPLLNGIQNYYFALLSPVGTPIYASYHGAPSGANPVGAFSAANEFALAGSVSISGFQTSPDAHQTTYPGGIRSGTLTYFNDDFQPLWNTYVGGSGDDQIIDIAVDPLGNIFLCGVTTSTGLATPGAHQETNNPAVFSAFLSKFNSQGELLYCTYLQGNGYSAFGSCMLSADGTKLYLSGGTNANSGIAFGGVQDEYQGGDADAFVACFNIESNQFLWSRYFGGAEVDGIGNIEVGPNDEIVLYGGTRSTTGIATPGAHQESPSNTNVELLDDTNRFLAVLDGDGNSLWGTYFGALPAFSSNFGLSVLNNEILVTGKQKGQEEIIMGNPLEDELLDVGSDFIAKFDLSNGEQLWGTYFGNGKDSPIFNISHLPDNRIFVFGVAISSNAYVSGDAWQNAYGGGDQDLYYAIFEEQTLSATSNIAAKPLMLQPNPAQNELRIDLDAAGAIDLQFFDLQGRSVKRLEHYRSGGAIDLEGLPAGLYMVHGSSGAEVFRGKLVVAR